MNDLTSFRTKTSKLGIDASVSDGTPVPHVEPSISSVRPDTGSQTSVSRTGDKSGDAANKTKAQKPRSRIAKSHGIGKPAGRINLDAMEDRAWLGGLIVGDGSIYASGNKNAYRKKLLLPMVSVIMCDKLAIQKAAGLMGVRRTASGKAPITGRRLWRVQAIGGRALEVLDLVKPFLTSTRIERAERAISKARDSGYKTRSERKDEKKLGILKLVRLKPGSSTRDIRSGTGLDTAYAHRYLNELVKEGRIRNAARRARTRIWNRWYLAGFQEDSMESMRKE